MEKGKGIGSYILPVLKWVLLGCLMGAVGGLLGAGFHHSLHFVTHLRLRHLWLIYLLPVGGLMTMGLYRLFRLRDNRGTNEIIDAILNNKAVKPMVAPVIFLASAVTHLFGGSAGREGAALQLGGSVASACAGLLHLKTKERTVLIMGGMSAVFAGLFGTPLTAALFTLEFAAVGTIFSPALLPCFLAAYVASLISGCLGVRPETAVIGTMGLDWQVPVLAVAVSVLGIAMCWVFHHLEHLAAKRITNSWLRILLGAGLIIAATVLVGDHRYNGAGMDMALEAVGGCARWYDFLLKLLFTAVTLAAGFKGGEIVPTFCIGATFGCVLGGLLGMDPGIAGALALVGLFCSVTNAPIAAMVLSVEMFGAGNLHLFALVCVICFVVSGHTGLYTSQVHKFHKIDLTNNDHN